MENLYKAIMDDLNKELIPPRFFARRFRYCKEDKYLLLYYYLGKHILGRKMLCWQVNLGTLAGSYLLGSPSTDYIFCVQEENYHLLRLAKRNIKSCSKDIKIEIGNEPKGKFDIVLMDGNWSPRNYIERLNTIWDFMEVEGILCVKNTDTLGTSLTNFCIGKHCEHIAFPAKFGTMIIKKF